MNWFLLISINEDGQIFSSRDRRLQSYLDDGWSIVGVIAVNGDSIKVIDFDRNYENKYNSFSITLFSHLTSIDIFKRWFASRPLFPTFSDWLQSASGG